MVNHYNTQRIEQASLRCKAKSGPRQLSRRSYTHRSRSSVDGQRSGGLPRSMWTWVDQSFELNIEILTVPIVIGMRRVRTVDTRRIDDGRELIERLRRCVAEERCITARLLVDMAEVDARGLYRDEGFSSMFDYCVGELHMSESETALRIRVARFGRAYPAAIQMLARGELHLSAISLLTPVMTAQRTELLQEVAFKSKREVEAILAKHFPQPDAPSRVRRLPATGLEHRSLDAADAERSSEELAARAGECEGKAARESGDLIEGTSRDAAGTGAREMGLSDASAGGIRTLNEGSRSDANATLVPARAKREPTPAPRPLSEGRYKVQFTASQCLRDKLSQAQHLMRHQIADGDLATILERALDLLIVERRKQLFAQPSRPQSRQSEARARSSQSARPNQASWPVTRAPEPRPTASSDRPASARVPVQPAADVPPETPPASTIQASRMCDPVSPAADVPPARPPASTVQAPGLGSDAVRQSVTREPAPLDSSRSRSRHIPNAVKREVVARDGERCSFVAPDGRRCHERGRLEFHHDRPFACGGAATVENIRLLCRSHNALMAERDFGRAFMVNATTTKQRPDTAPRSDGDRRATTGALANHPGRQRSGKPSPSSRSPRG